MTKAQEKIQRIRKTLGHLESDRVPVGEFFWTGFIDRCKEELGSEFDPYRYFDLDYVLVIPNIDPRIKPFEIIEQKGSDILVRTGFEATIRRHADAPMPHYDSFSVNTPERMAEFMFDSPWDRRRFDEAGDDQINCVADVLLRNIPSFKDRLELYVDDFAVFGGVLEPYEYLWRIIGSENALFWIGMETELLEAFVERIGEFLLEFTKAQIEAAEGKLAGMYVFGDVAYVNGMLFGAPRWRKIFKPHVKNIIDLCHANDLMVIYHGCGDARDIFDDMVEIGLDAYQPLEAKAGLDVVQLKKQYTGKLAFVGNIDVRVLEEGDPEAIKKHVIYKLQAAKGGEYICQSDHSVSSNVTLQSYAMALETIREYGNYPLDKI